ncbi:GGDEF domain-containing response regulator [Mesoaciditoga sp.]
MAGHFEGFFIKNGHDVITVEDGLQAYSKIYEISANALISDVVMPGLNGYQLCRILKKDPNLKGMPIILLTGSADTVDRFWSMYSGADAYIEKSSRNALENVEKMLEKFKWENKIAPRNGKEMFATLLDELLTETTLRAETRELSNHVEDMDYTVQKIRNLLKSIFNVESIAILVISMSEMLLYSSSKNPREMERTLLSEMKRPYFPSLHTYKTLAGKEEFSNLQGIYNVISYDGKEEGVIALWREKEFSLREKALLSIICEELGGIFKIGIQMNDYRKDAYFDDLTGIANFRAIEEHLEKLWKAGKDFELSIIDIDHFKKVNDTYGHEVGNEVLSGLGSMLKEFGEKNGIFVGRFGGEEFLLISEKVHFLTDMLEEFRQKVKEAHFSKSVPELTITVSAGVAVRDDLKSFTETIEYADKLLYEAKKGGRNMVRSYENLG